MGDQVITIGTHIQSILPMRAQITATNSHETATVLTSKQLSTLVGDAVRCLLEDVGGCGEGRRADAAGRDVRRAVGRAVILGILALREAGVRRIVLEREIHRVPSEEACLAVGLPSAQSQADSGEGPHGVGLLCLSPSFLLEQKLHVGRALPQMQTPGQGRKCKYLGGGRDTSWGMGK